MLDTEPDPNMVHVYPLNDSREHTLVGTVCWCNPKLERVEGSTIVIHSAADGRKQDYPKLHQAN